MSKESFRGCLVQGGLSALALLALGGLISQMSWENYEENKRLRDQESAEPYRGPDRINPPSQEFQYVPPQQQTMPETAPFPVYPSQQEQSVDNCAVYPDGVKHRDDVCVNGQCGGTFFGRRGPGIDDSWKVDGYDQNGNRFEADCTNTPRSAVVPDPNN